MYTLSWGMQAILRRYFDDQRFAFPCGGAEGGEEVVHS